MYTGGGGANLQQLQNVEANIEVIQCRVQHLEVCVVHILKDQAGRLGLRVPDNIQQLDHIRTTAQILQDLDLPLDLGSTGNVTVRGSGQHASLERGSYCIVRLNPEGTQVV